MIVLRQVRGFMVANDLFLIGLEEHYSTPELININGLAMSDSLREAHIELGV